MFRSLAILFLFFIVNSCSNDSPKNINKIEFQKVYLDVTEKEIIDNQNYINTFPIIDYWFNNSIFQNGFNGKAKLFIEKFSLKENINNKKRVINLDLKVFLQISKNNSVQKFNIDVNEFGNIEGNFSISEYEKLKEDIIINALNRLNLKIIEKL